MTDEKQKFIIPTLTTIDRILSELAFLHNCTYKRNLAYQLQFLEFMQYLLDYYDVYGSVEKSMIRQIVIITHNIAEYLLYISLKQVFGENPKGRGFPGLISKAKRRNLITKSLGGRLNMLNEARIKLHPEKQPDELDYHYFTPSRIKDCKSALDTLISELKDYFIPKNIEIPMEIPSCPAKAWHSLYLVNNEICPYCGEFGVRLL